MAKSKRTKKFEHKHLKDTIQRRKDFAKLKQKKQISAKKKARREGETATPTNGENGTLQSNTSPKTDKFGEMSVDDFFSGGFDIPVEPKNAAKKSASPVTGKRKRDIEGPDGHNKRPEPNGDARDQDSEASAEDHQLQLEELAKKDPEFYEYLRENDAELLEFEGEEGIPGIEDLTGSEDEDAEQSHGPPGRKGAKAFENELSMSTLKKWQAAMAEKHSVRSAKELVLAFRAAAHMDEEMNAKHKYSVSDSEGLI